MIQQEQPQEEQELEALPEFGQVEGEKIKLAGLDYSLLQRETALERKEKLLKQVKAKLGDHAHKMPVERVSGAQLTQDNDPLTKGILLSAHSRPAITQVTFYLFPLQPEFSPHQPEVITRRFGRLHVFPQYVYHKPEEIRELQSLIERDDKVRRLRREQQRQAKRVVPELQVQESDQDDIFAQESQQEEDDLGIQVGNKLSFGIQEQEIFGGPRYKEIVQEVEAAPKIVDKYDFLHKKRKPNEDEIDYDECYANTGPSLQEMKQLRKEGIQIFGDAKEYVQKERKYNINQDYAKIKRIIDEKSKKTS